MAVLTPIVSTDQESALLELLEQMNDEQNTRIAAGVAATVPKIIDDIKVDLKAGVLTFSGSLKIETTPSAGKSLMSVVVQWV